MIEVFKYLNGLSPDIMSDIFKVRENTYNLRHFLIIECQNSITNKLDLDRIAYRASQLWKNVPEEIRNSTSILAFKETIKKVPLISCSYNCCRKYITTWVIYRFLYIYAHQNLGYPKLCTDNLIISISIALGHIFTSGQYETLVDFY